MKVEAGRNDLLAAQLDDFENLLTKTNNGTRFFFIDVDSAAASECKGQRSRAK